MYKLWPSDKAVTPEVAADDSAINGQSQHDAVASAQWCLMPPSTPNTSCMSYRGLTVSRLFLRSKSQVAPAFQHPYQALCACRWSLTHTYHAAPLDSLHHRRGFCDGCSAGIRTPECATLVLTAPYSTAELLSNIMFPILCESPRDSRVRAATICSGSDYRTIPNLWHVPDTFNRLVSSPPTVILLEYCVAP
jgi:hypothetical protein